MLWHFQHFNTYLLEYVISIVIVYPLADFFEIFIGCDSVDYIFSVVHRQQN